MFGLHTSILNDKKMTNIKEIKEETKRINALRKKAKAEADLYNLKKKIVEDQESPMVKKFKKFIGL